MGKKWVPITAGVLDVLHGVWYAFMGLFAITMILTSPWRDIYGTETEGIILGSIVIALGALVIVGGAYAFKRKRWWLALAGSIGAIAPVALYTYLFWYSFDSRYLFSLTGLIYFIAVPAIVAIILTVLSRKQFVGK